MRSVITIMLSVSLVGMAQHFATLCLHDNSNIDSRIGIVKRSE